MLHVPQLLVAEPAIVLCVTYSSSARLLHAPAFLTTIGMSTLSSVYSRACVLAKAWFTRINFKSPSGGGVLGHWTYHWLVAYPSTRWCKNPLCVSPGSAAPHEWHHTFTYSLRMTRLVYVLYVLFSSSLLLCPKLRMLGARFRGCVYT